MQPALSGYEYDRLRAAMANSQHLRGTRSITDLAFGQIETLDFKLQSCYTQINQQRDVIKRMQSGDLAPWCVRVRNWWRRAVS